MSVLVSFCYAYMLVMGKFKKRYSGHGHTKKDKDCVKELLVDKFYKIEDNE